jgi:uncharacterized membrane protein YjdF
MKEKSKFLWWLVGVYGVLFAVLAVNPVERGTWFAENLTVWIILGVILLLYRWGEVRWLIQTIRTNREPFAES